MPEGDNIEPEDKGAKVEHKAHTGAVKVRRAPKTLDEAWDRAKGGARREFVKYHANEITEILDELNGFGEESTANELGLTPN